MDSNIKLIEELQKENEKLRLCNETQKETIRIYHIRETEARAKAEISKEIFEEIDKAIEDCKCNEYSKEGYPIRTYYNSSLLIKQLKDLENKYVANSEFEQFKVVPNRYERKD